MSSTVILVSDKDILGYIDEDTAIDVGYNYDVYFIPTESSIVPIEKKSSISVDISIPADKLALCSSDELKAILCKGMKFTSNVGGIDD